MISLRVLSVCCIVLAFIEVAFAQGIPAPRKMATLGDSITFATNPGLPPGFPDCLEGEIGGQYVQLCAEASWSFGSGGGRYLPSHWNWIRELLPDPNPTRDRLMLAIPGTKMSDLPRQAREAASEGVEYAVVLMGGNDACTDTVQQMTSVADFRRDFGQALQNYFVAEDRYMFVASVPNLRRLFDINRNNPYARTDWARRRYCESMLANPLSDEDEDVERRLTVLQRVIDYNAVIEELCALFAPNCATDGLAVFNFMFRQSHVSSLDYYHPSFLGQRLLAEITVPLAQQAFPFEPRP